MCFIHRLLVTDAVVYVSENIPDSIPDRDLLESGDGAFIFCSLTVCPYELCVLQTTASQSAL